MKNNYHFYPGMAVTMNIPKGLTEKIALEKRTYKYRKDQHSDIITLSMFNFSKKNKGKSFFLIEKCLSFRKPYSKWWKIGTTKDKSDISYTWHEDFFIEDLINIEKNIELIKSL